MSLVNKAREKTEEIIDLLRSNRSNVDKKVKPRTYRQDGRKSFLYRDLLVIDTLCQQQKYMYDNNVKSVNVWIVSIHQPHIRPIVRGKAGAHTEFRPKISISVVDGWSFLDNIRFDAYNEGIELIFQIAQYKTRFGYCPESVHADKIYRNNVNRKYCIKYGI